MPMEWEKWLPMHMNKQVVLLMAHYGCNMAAIEQKYRRLREELSSERYDVVLLFNVNDKSLLEETPCVDKICIYDLQDINALQYEPPNIYLLLVYRIRCGIYGFMEYPYGCIFC